VKAVALIIICLLMLGGCASHDTWSKSDRGAPEPPSLFDYWFRPGVARDKRLAQDLYYYQEKLRIQQNMNPLQGAPNSGTPDSGRGGLFGRGFLGPSTPNAYGPGMNADATGRPFIWQPDPGFGPPDPFSRVQPNAYGPGVGMDQYGRPVRPACPPGWAGPC